MREASRKISGGKTVKLRLDEETGRVTIHGDFFLHPEESIHDLEGFLSSIPPSIEEKEVSARISGFFKQFGVQPVGFSAGDLASLYTEVAN